MVHTTRCIYSNCLLMMNTYSVLNMQSSFLIFCWPCISIYLFININQLDALNFILSLFQASTCFEHMCSSSGGQKLYYTVSGIITPIGGCPVHGTATYRCDDTRDCIIQFCPPDDEHMCSKHVEVWNKLIIKFSASSLFIINKKWYALQKGEDSARWYKFMTCTQHIPHPAERKK